VTIAGALRAAALRHGLASRERKWRLYEQVFSPRRGERVLDVGVSKFDDLPGENYFLRRYPFSEQVTAVGIDDLSGLSARYPGVTFVRADGRALPFEDKSFDVVHCNAVVEHVGAYADQSQFVTELVRVAKAGFVTTPSRWFPIETHTRLPLVHWLPRRALLPTVRRLGHDEWPIWLLSKTSFRRLFPPSADVRISAQRFVGWPATLIFVFRTKP
jgi:hypothetical protein